MLKQYAPVCDGPIVSAVRWDGTTDRAQQIAATLSLAAPSGFRVTGGELESNPPRPLLEVTYWSRDDGASTRRAHAGEWVVLTPGHSIVLMSGALFDVTYSALE